MAQLDGPNAARIIRGAIAGELTERDFLGEWPVGANSHDDFLNSRNNLAALYEARRMNDPQMASLLEADLADAADSLEAGRPIEWFEVQPSWSRAASSAAVVVGVVGFIILFATGQGRWTYLLPLIVAGSVVLFAEWLWAKRVDASELTRASSGRRKR